MLKPVTNQFFIEKISLMPIIPNLLCSDITSYLSKVISQKRFYSTCKLNQLDEQLQKHMKYMSADTVISKIKKRILF